VDRPAAVVRNPQVRARALQVPSDPPVPDTAPAPAAALMVDVVVLSGDLTLYEAIRDAVGERNPVWRARSAEESVDLLLTGRCGVLLIDMAAMSSQPASLIEQIVDQFPDVVVVAAGRREDEAVLAGLISDGLVYRFMHKPLSPRRAGMFVNAAIRSHAERRASGRGAEPLLALGRELRSRVDPRKWLFVGVGLALFMASLAGVLVARYGNPWQVDPVTATATARTAPAATPLADPVLSRARAALAAGRYDAPAGRNALDLYAAALLVRPDDAEARAGLETTVARLLEGAERAASAGNVAEARRIAGRVLQADADHAGARALVARLAPQPQAQTQPQPAAVPPAAATEQPAPVTAPAPTAPARHAPTGTGRVQPDPLTPRILGSGSLPTSPSRPPRQAGSRSFGAPVSPGHPVAGYATSSPSEMTSAATATAFAPGTVSSVQERDLEPIAMPEPTYPRGALRDRVEGWVEVEFTVTERGSTRDLQVVASEPQGVFDAAAVAAVGTWTYRPRVVQGEPVAQRTAVTLSFSVED
jgi:TonB family protein